MSGKLNLRLREKRRYFWLQDCSFRLASGWLQVSGRSTMAERWSVGRNHLSYIGFCTLSLQIEWQLSALCLQGDQDIIVFRSYFPSLSPPSLKHASLNILCRLGNLNKFIEVVRREGVTGGRELISHFFFRCQEVNWEHNWSIWLDLREPPASHRW